ncbi:MAG TPA: glycoside hydrolase family 15 protein, partial [Terriglobia bacterium]
NTDPEGRYSIHKEVMAHPDHPCVLQKTFIAADDAFFNQLRVYVLCAPHLEAAGFGNNGHVITIAGRDVLAAEKNGTWLLVAASAPFSRLSCGYVGASDGWTDLSGNLQMDWEFDEAPDGNIALTGELDLRKTREFTTAIAFGPSLSCAATALFESLALPFEVHRKRFVEQWTVAIRSRLPLHESSGDGGRLYEDSYRVMLAHQDKTYRGAFIASLSIPWGEARGDKDEGGYHYVWTRDMVSTATGFLAAGDKYTALRALIYLATIQQADGRFPQNFLLDGKPYWGGIQLDEVAFPVMLAWRLHKEKALDGFDPYHLIKSGAAYLINNGPATREERWEDSSGYSPSTLAACIAALVCAGAFLRQRRETQTAQYIEDYSDFLVSHLQKWLVTTQGELVPGIPRHFIRILPIRTDDVTPDENPNDLLYSVPNRAPDSSLTVPAKNVVDAGFLELVRYGIMKPGDPVIADSIRVVDAILKVDTPFGPCWRRYNHDGYGQRDDGGSFIGWGTGRAWPLLTGERGHYELAAGHDVTKFIRTMENFAATGLLPEQVWDAADQPQNHLYFGRPTASAMPLVWAHAEYVKLLRSTRDKQVFDRIPEVAARYRNGPRRADLEIWKQNRQVQTAAAGQVLRIQAPGPFTLRWSNDGWQNATNTEAIPVDLGLAFVDIPIGQSQRDSIRFTFLWDGGRWENKDYEVGVLNPAATGSKAA